ncbi:MAG: SUMF1/EgtB/PvdO family nonheme iron enzyme [Kiritimatiellae bacterium]|nr:SUMF1/EgtB/PvdO family nonheme iron enzyme [Kiritimatiellia bacterium]
MRQYSCAVVMFLLALGLSVQTVAAEKSSLDINIPALERYDAYLKQKHPKVHAKHSAKLEEIRKLSAAQETVPQALNLREGLLLANPELDFEHMLLIKRKGSIAMPANWQSNLSLKNRSQDTIVSMPLRGERKLTTVYQPEQKRTITDIDLHFDAKRILFSMRSIKSKSVRWQVFDMPLDGKPQELSLIPDHDVDNYDACYLPGGNIIFTSTAPMVGVPCVKGSSHVANCYLFDVKTKKIRRLTFDQDHNWSPCVTGSGQVMYQRWEYSDIPHFVSRLIFTMNPDGTNQRGYYGSNSYWPNSIFYARPIPGSQSKFVGIVTGHHGVKRMGELVLFDTAKGYREADGVVQRIPGFGKKVEPVIRDNLVGGSLPKFLHPYPINEKFFIVSAQVRGKGWGIYLVDVFDNMLLLKEEPGHFLLEPIPIIKRKMPPVIPSNIQPDKEDAVMFISDIYQGDGLKGVPRGTVKNLRLFTYQFAYHGMGGQVNRVGLDGPWDVKRILGTVPVESDGSAMFRVPANTPVSMQPLDSKGRAIAIMRSWATAMPGEVLSCVGCHEPPNTAPPLTRTKARTPVDIKPWYGPVRGFSFEREVQPILDKYCIGCHDSSQPKLPDFRRKPPVHADVPSSAYKDGTKFLPSYIALRSYVRTPTMESDIHLQPPYEFHVSTTELIQRLEKGHHNVKLDQEAWDRLYTWIDLHAPAHGSWREVLSKEDVGKVGKRRLELMKLYSMRDDDEELIAPKPEPVKTIMPKPEKVKKKPELGKGLTAEEAEAVQKDVGNYLASVTAGDKKVEMVLMPGDKKQKPFWVSKFEVTNELYREFDSKHDPRVEHGDFLVFSEREMGYPLNKPEQPVCRVSYNEAEAFCEWLSKKAGRKFRLPTAAEWEYACRAGSTTDHWYGSSKVDFAAYANLADQRFRHVDKFGWGLPVDAVPKWRPAIESVNDTFRVSAPVGTFKANPWGLHDMHGNVAEWTSTGTDENKTVKGGSWYDRPIHATSSFKLYYHSWQKVFNVGFRVVMED